MKTFKRFFAAFFIIFLGLTIVHHFVLAQEKLEMVYFWGDGCPHCAKEKVFLEKLEKKYPELEIKRYEVWYNPENQKLFKEYAEKYNVQQLGVPLTIINDKYFIGYGSDETSGREIENYIKQILEKEKSGELSWL